MNMKKPVLFDSIVNTLIDLRLYPRVVAISKNRIESFFMRKKPKERKVMVSLILALPITYQNMLDSQKVMPENVLQQFEIELTPEQLKKLVDQSEKYIKKLRLL